MAKTPEDERHSQAEAAELIADPEERARRETANGLRQFDYVYELVAQSLDPERPFKLRVSHILGLNRTALQGVHAHAGNFRPAGVEIGGSKHEPPDAIRVPELVEDMCDYVNDNWETQSAVHLAAYVMWRLNWIHPFVDGNGRTSRALSYFILCAKLGYWVPGTETVPELIAENKKPYYDALEAADQASKGDDFNVSALEELLGRLLARQLMTIHRNATGSKESA